MDSDEMLVEERFAALSSALTAVVVPPPAAQIRARGDRRRVRLAAGRTIAVVVVGLLVGLTVVIGPGRSVGPTSPDDSLVLAIPPDFRLSHDGEAGWSRQDDRAAPSIFIACDGSDSTLRGRTDAVTAAGPGFSAGDGAAGTLREQVLLFVDADASGAAVGNMVSALSTCGWAVGVSAYDGVPGALVDRDVFETGRAVPASASGPAGYEEAVVLRRGNALWIKVIRVPGASMAFYREGPIDVRAELCARLHQCLR